MSGRIDYRHNAQERVKVAVTHPNETQAQTVALIAQAEATLALVEQQRIANLIALAQVTVVPGDMPVFRGVIWEGEHLSLEIREGLGL